MSKLDAAMVKMCRTMQKVVPEHPCSAINENDLLAALDAQGKAILCLYEAVQAHRGRRKLRAKTLGRCAK